MTTYSEKELRLIKLMGYMNVIHDIPATRLYNMMAMDCFLYPRSKEITQSLQNCIMALENCTVNRLTKEWDDLIII